MNADQLIAALKVEIDKHSWPHYPVAHTASMCCKCGAEMLTAAAWSAHLRDVVLPKAIREHLP